MADMRGNYRTHRKLLNIKRLRRSLSGECSPVVKYWTLQWSRGMDQTLEAQLRATLNMIPASMWYATPSGGLVFVNARAADYGGLSSDHPLRHGTATSPA